MWVCAWNKQRAKKMEIRQKMYWIYIILNAKVDTCIAARIWIATEQATPIGQVLKMASTQGVPQYISFISGPFPHFLRYNVNMLMVI